MSNYIIEQLKDHLIRDLKDRSGFEFEEFVAMLLSKKYGSTKWPPRDGSDGKIDFASEDNLFQIYGAETKRGSISYMKKKIIEVQKMRQTAEEAGLKAKNIIFLTNIHPNEKMGMLILNVEEQGILIKDIYKTAEYLYDVYYPFKQLKGYYNHKSRKLMEEDWPYDIDENTFVENFDFRFGEVLVRNHQSEKDCLSFIFSKILEVPVICVGYYGMGKTTLSKMLFKKWRDFDTSFFPVYISLTHKAISDFNEAKLLSEQVVNEIKNYAFQKALSDSNYESKDELDEEMLEKNIYRMIENKKIILIFDGIDESRCERDELMRFLEFVLKNNFLVFLTVRLEYRPFFDVYQAVSHEKNFDTCIELCEWKKPQWDKYINSLVSLYPLKKDLISKFNTRLSNEVYSTLPGRPLFLKMLSDLEINNTTGISILPKLASNLAEIYFKFIKWEIRDDYDRKGGATFFDRSHFENDCFSLLTEIAILEYQSVLKGEVSQVDLKTIRKICSEKNFDAFNDKYIRNVLLKSSLFAILRRTQDDRYMFSHKSFMEYLVAFKLASCLFPEDMNAMKSICDDTWNLFQMHEISQHLINEVERIKVTKEMSINKRNEFILNAFKKVIDEKMKDDLMIYDEGLQEVLYYIGKFEINHPELTDILEKIIINKERYHPVYFRTASLALSMVKRPEYCEKYALYLLDDRENKRKDFILNQEIQKRYYGEATLRQILKKDIDNYISQKNTSSIISLEIITYFTTAITIQDELFGVMEYLDRVYNAALKQGHANIQMICSKLKDIR